MQRCGEKFAISTETIDKAKVRAEALPLLNNSIRKGRGAIVAYIGEEVVRRVLDGKIEDTYDYDVIYGDSIKVDVKTKERTVPPKPSYNCTVADFNTRQKCDEYAFVSVLDDHSAAWYLGKMSKEDFYREAKFHKKGELDPDSPPSRDFFFRADCYNIPISRLCSLSYEPIKPSGEEIIKELQSEGVRVYLIGDNPKARAIHGKISPESIRKLKENRDEIVRVLGRRKKNPPCYACGSEIWWNSKHTQRICTNCHPPVNSELVVA